MVPPAIMERLDDFRMRRAATHPAIAAHCSRCPRQTATPHRIVFKDSDQLHALCWTMLEIVQDLKVPATRKQLFRILFEQLCPVSSEQRPRPTQLHIVTAASASVASGSGTVSTSSAQSLTSKCNRRHDLEPYSPTPSTSSIVSIHDDLLSPF